MKANELMIGDWVSYKNGFSDGEMTINTVVGTISEKYITEFVWGKRIDCEHLYPIPLTAEILEKNGFVRSKVFVEWKYGDGEVSMLWKPFPFLTVNCDGAVVKFPCEHVHELQHALRLCGIEKEIEL